MARENEGVLRGKLVCAEHGVAVVAVLGLVALVAFAGAGWAHAHPPTETVTVDTHRQTFATTANTSAVVTRNSSLWRTGTRLEDRSFYPTAAPNLSVHVQTTVPEKRRVEVSHRLTAVYRVREDGETIWETERVLGSEHAAVFDGEASFERTVNVRRLADARDRFNEELTGIGRADVRLRLTVTYESDRYAGELSRTTGVSIGAKGYRLDGSFAAREVHTTPATRTIEGDNGQTAGGLALLGLASALGAVAAGYVHRRGEDPDDLRGRLERARHGEWISEGHLDRPIGSHDIAMRSLADLVDVAIDSNRRVIYDRDREIYAVVDPGAIYYYAPDGLPTVPSLPSGADDPPDSPAVEPSTAHDPWETLLQDDVTIDDESTGSPEDTEPTPSADIPEPREAMADGSHDAWADFLDEE